MHMNKLVYLGMSILELSKIVMYQFWQYYVKPKYGETAKLCHMDIDSFIIHIKTDFVNTLQNMLDQGLIHETMNQADLYLKKKIKKQLD